MANLIDEEGNLLGIINIVDALVLLLVGAVLVAGVSLVVFDGGDQTDQTAITVEYQSEHLQPYVAEAIPEGNVPSSGIASVRDKTVTASANVTQDESGNLSVKEHPTHQTVTLQLRLNVTMQNGDYLYNGTPIQIGTDLTLDFGRTTVSGQVIGFEEIES